MRYVAWILVLFSGCVAGQPRATGGGDAAQMLARVEAQLDVLSKSVVQAPGSKYSGGAGWVALVAGIAFAFVLWSTWMHLKSRRDRERMKSVLTGDGR